MHPLPHTLEFGLTDANANGSVKTTFLACDASGNPDDIRAGAIWWEVRLQVVLARQGSACAVSVSFDAHRFQCPSTLTAPS